MQANRALRMRLTVQSWIFLALFLTLVTLLAFIALEQRIEWDVTHNARNTLAQPTLDLLRQIEGPLKVSDGSWTMTPQGKGTRVVYQTDVDPGIPVPPALVGNLMKRGLPEVLTAIRLRVESGGKWKKPS